MYGAVGSVMRSYGRLVRNVVGLGRVYVCVVNPDNDPGP